MISVLTVSNMRRRISKLKTESQKGKARFHGRDFGLFVGIGQRKRVNEQADNHEADQHGADPKIGADPVALFRKHRGSVESRRATAALQFA